MFQLFGIHQNWSFMDNSALSRVLSSAKSHAIRLRHPTQPNSTQLIKASLFWSPLIIFTILPYPEPLFQQNQSIISAPNSYKSTNIQKEKKSNISSHDSRHEKPSKYLFKKKKKGTHWINLEQQQKSRWKKKSERTEFNLNRINTGNHQNSSKLQMGNWNSKYQTTNQIKLIRTSSDYTQNKTKSSNGYIQFSPRNPQRKLRNWAPKRTESDPNSAIWRWTGPREVSKFTCGCHKSPSPAHHRSGRCTLSSPPSLYWEDHRPVHAPLQSLLTTRWKL